MNKSPLRTAEQLRADVQAIWKAGVDAVRSDRLVRENVQVADGMLCIAEEEIPLNSLERIIVVGAGKAGAGMAQGLEEGLGAEVLWQKKVKGWVNVPADCVKRLTTIHLHPARPAGKNEPTADGVQGTQEILRLVSEAGPKDLVICLISGGGSALLPAPCEGVLLEDKLQLARHLSAAGANIAELNTVRTQLSLVKGGGLARASRAGRFITLIISDVIGDPLDIIASGPTIATSSTAKEALQVLEKFDPQRKLSGRIYDVLQKKLALGTPKVALAADCFDRVTNHILGNNAVCVDAAGVEAEKRGYSHAMNAARTLEGSAESVGEHLAKMALSMRDQSGPDCLITGGEPVVQLAPTEIRGLGGRNQQLVLAALDWLMQQGKESAFSQMAILSGGTDGEDGPTDAAGAMVDGAILNRILAEGLSPAEYLKRSDAYHFFEKVGGLIKTGPTHTNTCDLRVVVVARKFVV